MPDPPPPEPDEPRTLIPTSVVFEGMPNARWWAFEDGRTNFGDVDAATTDVAKLLFLEFGLVYSNDWFLIPAELPAACVAGVRGLAVTNVFGERTWVEPAGAGPDDAWQRWSMFTVNVKGEAGEAADTSLLLLPTVPKIQESDPLEEVMMIRDEMANMVWGIEWIVPLPSGDSKRGSEAGRETYAYLARLLGSEPAPPAGGRVANVRYLVMTSVPEDWIPFVPVHVPGDVRQIQLQRAGLPRIIEGGPPAIDKVAPRTVLLREGLDVPPPEARSPTSCSRRRSRARARGSPRATSARAGGAAGRSSGSAPAGRPAAEAARAAWRSTSSWTCRRRSDRSQPGRDHAATTSRSPARSSARQRERCTLPLEVLGTLRGLTSTTRSTVSPSARATARRTSRITAAESSAGVSATSYTTATRSLPPSSTAKAAPAPRPQGRDRRLAGALDVGRVVVAAGGDHDVLDPAGHVQLAIAQDAEVAGAQLAAGERGRRLRGPPPVAGRDAAAGDPDLPLPILGGDCHAGTVSRGAAARDAAAEPRAPPARDHQRRLREPVAREERLAPEAAVRERRGESVDRLLAAPARSR